MDLETEVAAINAAPISQDQKNSIIAKLILDAAAMHPDAATTDVLAVAANRAALQATVSSTATNLGAQATSAQTQAGLYTPVPPKPNDGSLDAVGNPVNPLNWAYREFVAAGYANPAQANGPLDRWSGEGALPGDPTTWVPAFLRVIQNYAAGTANMATGRPPAPGTTGADATPAATGGYTDEQKMAMQYVHVGGPNSDKARAWLEQQIGNTKYLDLDQMFGSSGTATLYNPLAGQAMNQLLSGKSAADVLANLKKSNSGTDGYNESLAQLTPAWFTQATATIAQFKG